MDIGAPELLIILVIGLLIFGSNKLPKLARSLGQASREFKEATSPGWVEEKVTAATTTPTPPAATAVPPVTTPPVTTPPVTTPTAAAPEATTPTTEAPEWPAETAAGPGATVGTPGDAGPSDDRTTPGR
ncbi:MAG: sec-independent protein translocase protein TatA [Actinomycetota bacterium]|nr:sec-independent protein translocase protein TatA [Actinomycetota bacterium]